MVKFITMRGPCQLQIGTCQWHLGLPRGLRGKQSACSAGDVGLILGGEDPLEEGMATNSVFLPEISHGQWSLAGYSPWGHTESDNA